MRNILSPQEGNNDSDSAPVIVTIKGELLHLGFAVALLIGLSWCTPLIVGHITSYGFTYVDFWVIAIIAVLLLGLARWVDYLRMKRTFFGGLGRLILTTIEAYAAAIVVFILLR